MADSVKIKIDGDDSGFKKSLSGIGSTAGTMLKGVCVAAVAAGAAAIALGTAVVNAYGEYEQLVGGVETLFGTSAETVKQYADNAYATAQMSANDYMSTVTSFSASLLQSLDGDTAAAAEKADMAITDMADNANKMGTTMESIENAYQGFAKQNYTMLDNLKLGYGGTKEEMQRLLDDASKLSGIEYDISSYSDIVDAIHVVQTEMGITGTSAEEAAKTVSGSMNMMKAAAENWITGLGDADADMGQLTQNMIDSFNLVVANVTPVLENIVSALPTAITAIVGAIGELLPTLLPTIAGMISELLGAIIGLLPELIPIAVEAIMTVANALIENLPLLIAAGMQIVSALGTAIIENLPAILEAGLQAIVMLAQGLAEALPELYPAIYEVLFTIIDTLIENAPMLIDAAIALLTGIAEGMLNSLPLLVEKIPELILALIEAIVENLPLLLDAAVQIIIALATGLIQALPTLIQKIPEILMALVQAFAELAPQLWESGKTLISELGRGLWDAFVDLLTQVGTWFDENIKQPIDDKVSEFLDIGKNMVEGIWNGITDKMQWIKDKISGWVSDVTDWFKLKLGISSPSKLFRDTIGKFIGEGIAVGITATGPDVRKALDGITDPSMCGGSVATAYGSEQGGSYSTTNNSYGGDTYNVYAQKATPSEIFSEARYQRERTAMTRVSA